MNTAAISLFSNIVELTTENINTILMKNPSAPKAILFKEKLGYPIIKGLSIEFENKIAFGIIKKKNS